MSSRSMSRKDYVELSTQDCASERLSSKEKLESITEQRARLDEEKAHKQFEAREQIWVAEAGMVDGQALVQAGQHRDQAWHLFCEGLGVDEQTMRAQTGAEFIWGLVNMTYMLVIVGCEMDLYGFGMSFMNYWRLGEAEFPFLKCALILGIVGYLLAFLMYVSLSPPARTRKVPGDEFRTLIQIPQQCDIPGITGGTPPPLPEPPQATASTLVQKETIQLKPYHFLPIMRYYLVVKDKTADDIEGIFRSNSLSSFTLGVSQICGILFTLHNNGCYDIFCLDIFLAINIFSQCINWIITILYFLTPLSSKMGSVIKVEALTYNNQKRLQGLYERYLSAVAANPGDAAGELRISQVEQLVDAEIRSLTKKRNLDLSLFTMKQKFTALKYLNKQQCKVYADI